MGAEKRKAGPGAGASGKGAKTTSESRPPKRAKSEQSPKKNAGKTDSKKENTSKPTSNPGPTTAVAAVVSTLKEDEPLFPRGGGSVLTPLEQKQIQIQAKQDVLFEQASGEAAGKAEKSSKKKRRKSSAKDEQGKLSRGEDAVKIESLNFKVRF